MEGKKKIRTCCSFHEKNQPSLTIILVEKKIIISKRKILFHTTACHFKNLGELLKFIKGFTCTPNYSNIVIGQKNEEIQI